MSSHQGSNQGSHTQSPKHLLSDQQREDMVKEFFDVADHKAKFPILTMNLVEEAINADFMPFEMRDKILRNPNKLSIFFVPLNPESPKTREALHNLRFTEEACQVTPFHQFQDPKMHPLQSLVKYMGYLQDKYRELLLVIQARNKIKRERTQKTKQSVQSFSQFFVTDCGVSTHSIQKSYPNRSLDFNTSSYDEKLEIQSRKHEDYIRVLSNHLKMEEQHMQGLNSYYNEIVPIREQKVKKIQQLSHQQLVQRKLKYKERSERTLNKIKKLEQMDVEKRNKLKQELIEKQQQIDQNRSQVGSMYQLEQQKHYEEAMKKEEFRKLRKIQAIQSEIDLVNNIMEKNHEKDLISEELMLKQREDQLRKRQQNQQLMDIAQKKVQTKQEQTQYEKLQNYLKTTEDGRRMIEEQNKLRQYHLNDLKTKSEKQWQRVKKNKETLGHQFYEKLESLRNKDTTEEVNHLNAIQMSIDMKIKEQAEKNRYRHQRAMNRTQQFQEQQEMNTLELIDKLIDKSQKSKQIRLENELLREGTLKQHLLMRQRVDKLIL